MVLSYSYTPPNKCCNLGARFCKASSHSSRIKLLRIVLHKWTSHELRFERKQLYIVGKIVWSLMVLRDPVIMFPWIQEGQSYLEFILGTLQLCIAR